MGEYPSIPAMKAAVELEIEKCLGFVTTQSIGEQIQKVVDAALAPYKWQPIETAPRDGTAILLTDARIQDWTQVAFWDEDRPNGYVWARDDASTFWHKDSFTHWMPLPRAPTA